MYYVLFLCGIVGTHAKNTFSWLTNKKDTVRVFISFLNVYFILLLNVSNFKQSVNQEFKNLIFFAADSLFLYIPPTIMSLINTIMDNASCGASSYKMLQAKHYYNFQRTIQEERINELKSNDLYSQSMGNIDRYGVWRIPMNMIS